MSRKVSTEQGFSAIEALIVVVVIAVIGVAGWLVWQHHHQQKKAATSSSSTTTQTNKQSSGTQTADPYAGWKTYRSNLGSFTLRYPTTWELSGFRGETPVGSLYSTGEMNGQENIIRLVNTEDSKNQFLMDITLSSQPTNDYDKYSDGTTASLTNGLTLWTHSQQDPGTSGSVGNCPDIQLVSGTDFIAKLSNGTSLSLNGSFCVGRSTPTYTYTQQVSSVSFRDAKQIVGSIEPSN